jgi:hypothetical protein
VPEVRLAIRALDHHPVPGHDGVGIQARERLEGGDLLDGIAAAQIGHGMV